MCVIAVGFRFLPLLFLPICSLLKQSCSCHIPLSLLRFDSNLIPCASFPFVRPRMWQLMSRGFRERKKRHCRLSRSDSGYVWSTLCVLKLTTESMSFVCRHHPELHYLFGAFVLDLECSSIATSQICSFASSCVQMLPDPTQHMQLLRVKIAVHLISSVCLVDIELFVWSLWNQHAMSIVRCV